MLSWIYNICRKKTINYLGFKNTWEMFYSVFLLAQVIITCPKTTICNSCEQEYVSYYTLYADGNDEQQEYFGFSCSFFKSPIPIGDITKIKLMKINSTPLLNIYEKQLKNLICDD